MPSYVISENSSMTQYLTVSDANWIVAEGVYITTDLFGVVSNTDDINQNLTVYGHISDGRAAGIWFSPSVDGEGRNSITIGASGTVEGLASGIVSFSNHMTITNAGLISAAHGVFTPSGDDVRIVNTGLIFGHGYEALDIGSSNSSVYNSGLISGSIIGIISDTSADIVNDGRIVGGTTAIKGSFIDDSVINSGEISGTVLLGSGNDTFQNIGGTVKGDLDLGDGNDRFVAQHAYQMIVSGGFGNDVYEIDAAGIDLRESFGGGYDTIKTRVDFVIPANFERLELVGSGSFTGIGNDKDNSLTGNSNANILSGLDGNDVLTGYAGADLLDGGKGRDRANYTASNVAVFINLMLGAGHGGQAEGDVLITVENVAGSYGADTLIGNDERNRLNGMGGNDTLAGGGGRDVFSFGPATDQDTIVDFQIGKDHIRLSTEVFVNFADVQAHMVQNGNDAVLTSEVSDRTFQITISGHTIGDFSESDFIFA